MSSAVIYRVRLILLIELIFYLKFILIKNWGLEKYANLGTGLETLKLIKTELINKIDELILWNVTKKLCSGSKLKSLILILLLSCTLKGSEWQSSKTTSTVEELV